MSLINGLQTEEASHKSAAERVSLILDRYQEQPSVLDPSLESMVLPLLSCVRLISRHELSKAVLPSACRIMYSLCKVRGYKTIVKFVPHEVHDLEPLVALLVRKASWIPP